MPVSVVSAGSHPALPVSSNHLLFVGHLVFMGPRPKSSVPVCLHPALSVGVVLRRTSVSVRLSVWSPFAEADHATFWPVKAS